MFDRITVMVPLPEYPADAPKEGFWTTDFGCDETLFIIREDGRLLSELWHLESVPIEEQEFRDDVNCLIRAGGQNRKVINGFVQRDFNGTLRFSRYHNDKLYEFEGEFMRGVLRELRPRRRAEGK